MGRKARCVTVNQAHHGVRLDKFLLLLHPTVSRSQIRKIIDRSGVLINELPAKAGIQLQCGDHVSFDLDSFEPQKPSLRAVSPAGLDVVFEDASLIVINKPAGLSVHPGAGETPETLVEKVLAHTGALSPIGEEELRPGVVHRLDKDTSGLLVFAKTQKAHEVLSEQFRDKTAHREYWVVVDGVLEKPCEVKASLIRDPAHRTRYRVARTDAEAQAGRSSETRFEPVEHFFHCFSLLRARLATGRTHQVRVHCRDVLRMPVVGDQSYGVSRDFPQHIPSAVLQSLANVKRQMLHARILRFIHPVSDEDVVFEREPPDDMLGLLNALRSQPGATSRFK